METIGAMAVLRETPLTDGLRHPDAIARRLEAIGGARCG